jgi:hypothetical protein
VLDWLVTGLLIIYGISRIFTQISLGLLVHASLTQIQEIWLALLRGLFIINSISLVGRVLSVSASQRDLVPLITAWPFMNLNRGAELPVTENKKKLHVERL